MKKKNHGSVLRLVHSVFTLHHFLLCSKNEKENIEEEGKSSIQVFGRIITGSLEIKREIEREEVLSDNKISMKPCETGKKNDRRKQTKQERKEIRNYLAQSVNRQGNQLSGHICLRKQKESLRQGLRQHRLTQRMFSLNQE